MNRTWQTSVDGPLPMRCWDGDYVVYNPLSGNTHVLDVIAGEVLGAIMPGAIDDRQLRAHVADFLDVPNDESVAGNLEAILTVLDDLGLIEPLPGC